MGLRLRLDLFKGPDTSGFERAVEAVAARSGGTVHWDELDAGRGLDFRTSHREVVHAAYLEYCGGEESYFQKLWTAATA
jgi:hypothetical protein